MRFFSLLFFIFCNQLSIGQGVSVFKAKVLDTQTKQAIELASAGMPNKMLFTFSNSDGDFAFKFPAIAKDDNLEVLAIGYEPFSQKISDIVTHQDSIIWLKPIPQMAPDSSILKKADPKTVIKRALAKIELNYPTENYAQTGFYREIWTVDSLTSKVNEGVLKVEKYPYASREEPAEKIKLLKGRKFENIQKTNELPENFGFDNGASIVSRSMETAPPEYLMGKAIDDYVFTLSPRLTAYDGQAVAQIDFKPISKKIKAAREGTIFIDTTSLAILKINYEFTPEGTADLVKTTLARLMGKTKTHVKRFHGHYIYRKIGQKYYLQNSGLILETDFLENKIVFQTASIAIEWAVNEVILRKGVQMRDTEILEDTDNFPRAGGRYDENFWGNFNYLKANETVKSVLPKR
jgi:hypothetical protein